MDRARALDPSFHVSDANAPAIAEICVRLDGLPLAIELAAARIPMLPPEAILRRLATRLPLLTRGPRDLPARQHTLRGTIGWSYDLLGPNERSLFRRMAVFAGDSTLDAVEAISSERLDVDVLEALLDHNLVRPVEAGDEPRFDMLETIREFGLERLEVSRESRDVHQRHALYVRSLVESTDLDGPSQNRWVARIESEHDNVRLALSWTLEHDPPAALRLATGPARFWGTRGYLREGLAWLERVLETDDGPLPQRSPGRTSGRPHSHGHWVTLHMRANTASERSPALGSWRTISAARRP